MRDIFDAVKSKASIRSVYETLTGHKARSNGRDIQVRCPLPEHEDKNPSASLNLEKRVWFCHACGVGGDVVTMVEKVRGLEPLDAAKWVAQKYKVEYNEDGDPETGRRRARERQQRQVRNWLMENFVDRCHKQLTAKHREQLHNRGISDETIDRYRIGFEPNKEPSNAKAAQRLGLLGGKNDSRYLAARRIIIPFRKGSKPVYWIAWNPNSNVKYMFPKGLNKPLLGIEQVKKDQPVYLVEGVFDHLSMMEADIPSLCTLGTQLSHENISVLRQAVDSDLLIAFDGDEAGQDGAEELAEQLWPEIKAEIVRLPANTDINNLWVKVSPNGESFERILNNLPRQNLLQMGLGRVKEAEMMEQKRQLAEGVYMLVAQLDDVERDISERELQAALGGQQQVRIDAVRGAVRRAEGTLAEEHEATTLSSGDESQSDELVNLALEACGELFCDQYGRAFAAVGVEGHREIWPLNSDRFENWLAWLYRQREGSTPGTESLGNAIRTLTGQAQFEGEEPHLNNRTAEHDDYFYYDLTDEEWRTVKIGPDGHRVVEEYPILFRRYSHQAPQVVPAEESDFDAIFDVVNVDVDSDQALLIKVWLVSALVPDIPHPAPMVHGDKGSAKTWLLRILRDVVDPSQLVEGLSIPREDRELAQLLNQHYAPVFDNVGRLPRWVSDFLCHAITGGGFTKRKLYTDEESVTFTFKRCVAINGINLAATEPDLLDRSLIFRLNPIPREKRKREDELLERWNEIRPEVLAGVFHTLSGAMARIDDVELSHYPRMADFCRWGFAATEAMGEDPFRFLRAYYANIDAQSDAVLEADMVAQAILLLMDNRHMWEGSTGKLYRKLSKVAEDNNGLNPNAKEWPQAANALTRRLNEIRTVLGEKGLEANYYRKPSERGWTLEWTEAPPLEEHITAEGDGNDDLSQHSDTEENEKDSPILKRRSPNQSGKLVVLNPEVLQQHRQDDNDDIDLMSGTFPGVADEHSSDGK